MNGRENAMTNEEIKQAFLKQCPVIDMNPIYRSNIIYGYIIALVHTIEGNEVVLSVALQDRNTNSVTLADPQYIFVKE